MIAEQAKLKAEYENAAKVAAAEEFEGVIVGKAYYEGRIDLKKAVAELSK
jgi:phosphoribosylformimino-5-aminoimidazole carboxamide ribonucleotide (ProFAR) isomerase